jgi:sulfur relay protein TusB/DsrH
LLTEDAVYLANHYQLLERIILKTTNIYALTADIEARGVESIKPLKNISYSDMVELCVTYSKVVSW